MENSNSNNNKENKDNKDVAISAEVVKEVLAEVGENVVTVAAMPGALVYEEFVKFLQFLGEFSIILYKACSFILRGAINIRDTFFQMSVIGVNSLPIVLITVAFSSAVLSLYMSQIVVKWGLGSYTGAVIGLSVSREIAPVLTAVVVAARSGSAMAAELGSMKVTEQIDALKALAVSPIQYLVVPRLIASVTMLPVICMIGMVVGIYGGYLVAITNGVPSGGFINNFRAQVEMHDILMGLLKTVFFGFVIAGVGSQQGLHTTGGATGVGRSTTGAVVISIVIIYILNFLLAYVMFGGRTAFL